MLIVIVRVVEIRVLEEVDTFHQAMLIITKEMWDVVIIPSDLIYVKRRLLLYCIISRLNQVILQSKCLGG